MRSLQARLTFGLLASLITLFVLQLLVAQMGIAHLLESSLRHKLAEDADELYTAMNLDGRRGAPLDQPDPTFIAQHLNHYFEVFVGGEKVYASDALAGESLGTATLPDGAPAPSRAGAAGGNPLLVHAKSYQSQGRQIHIAVGADLTQHNRYVGGFLWRYSLLSGLVLVVLMLMQIWVVRKALAVLAQVRTQLVKVRRGEAPAVDEQVPAEVLPLVREINQLSQAMAERLQRSREALGNFAHAFKTPLTVLSQVAQDERLHDRPEIMRTVAQQVGLLRGRVNLELKRARLAGPGGLAQPLDLCEEVRTLAKTIALIYRDKQLDIVCSLPLHAHFQGDREDMLELFGNLLDNACKYGLRRVRVSVAEETKAAGLSLMFEDDGPGCAPEQFAQLTQRGARFDSRTPGNGLGLAIAAEIVASYGGTLTFARSEQLGGLRASVWLPSAPDAG